MSLSSRYIHERRKEEQHLREPALLGRDASKTFQFFCVYDGDIEAGLHAVMQQNQLDDLTGGSWQSEAELGDADYRIDVRDLLFDEAD